MLFLTFGIRATMVDLESNILLKFIIDLFCKKFYEIFAFPF